MSKSLTFAAVSVGISAATKALNVGAAALPDVGPLKIVFAVLVVSLSKNAPLPKALLIVVAVPPAPPVPIPI